MKAEKKGKRMIDFMEIKDFEVAGWNNPDNLEEIKC